MATSNEDLVQAEAEAITRRADLERRAPEAAQAVDDFMALVGHSPHFCTSCDFKVEQGESCCPDGTVREGVPPKVLCRRCWGDFGPHCCTGRHAGAIKVNAQRVMTPEAVAKEAELRKQFPEDFPQGRGE